MAQASMNPDQEVTRRDALRSVFAALAAPAALSQAGCGSEVRPERSFFNGAVTAEVFHSMWDHTHDFANFSFKEPGVYEVSFSITPGKPRYGENSMPKTFSIEVANDETPREVLVEQFVLPKYLRITISKGKNVERQDF